MKKNISTATSVAGVKFDSCVCNASGVKDTTLEELQKIAKSDSSAVVMKSSTMEETRWDDGPRAYYLGVDGMVQSNGLQNVGYKTAIMFAKKIKKYGKKIISSVAGSSISEYVTMVTAFQKSTVDLIEVNISCPNIPGKSQIGYDFSRTEELLVALRRLGHKPVGLKLPPYFDHAHWDAMAELILRYDISFITTINSIGNVLVIDPWERSTVIKPKKGYAGLCGEGLDYVANANIRAFYDRLEGRVSIFGVGGVKGGISAFTRIIAGADALQVGNAFQQGDHKIFSTIDQELKGLLEYHGFSSVQEAKGQLLYR